MTLTTIKPRCYCFAKVSPLLRLDRALGTRQFKKE